MTDFRVFAMSALLLHMRPPPDPWIEFELRSGKDGPQPTHVYIMTGAMSLRRVRRLESC